MSRISSHLETLTLSGKPWHSMPVSRHPEPAIHHFTMMDSSSSSTAKRKVDNDFLSSMTFANASHGSCDCDECGYSSSSRAKDRVIPETIAKAIDTYKRQRPLPLQQT